MRKGKKGAAEELKTREQNESGGNEDKTKQKNRI